MERNHQAGCPVLLSLKECHFTWMKFMTGLFIHPTAAAQHSSTVLVSFVNCGFFILMIDVGGPRSLWIVLTLGR